MRLPPHSLLDPCRSDIPATVLAFARALACALLAGLLSSRPAHSDELIVPDQFLTIQAAIDAAESGDNILVRQGTYRENLLIIGKSLRIESVDGPDVTRIDGRTPTRPDTLSVITVISAEEFVCTGFTISNSLGGIDFGAPTVPNSGGGFALLATGGTISHCVVAGNFCPGEGGGLYLAASGVLLQDCIIRDNTCQANGAGISALASSPVIERCVIEGNAAGPDGLGGGIFARMGAPQIRECEIIGNEAAGGGGIGLSTSSATVLLTLMADNTATMGTGGGLLLFDGSPRIESCTVVGNRGASVAGVFLFNESNTAISRTIIAFNLDGEGLRCSGGSTIECCDVFGNEGGDKICDTDLGGNFALDPMLCQDHSIAASSPCAPGNSPPGCGLVGALEVGCTGAVAPVSWGRIKYRYDASAR